MENNQKIPSEYKVLSPWAYFGYNILFAIPLVGWICLIVFAFDNSNLNRRNYARSFSCGLVLVVVIILFVLVLFATGIFTASMFGLAVPQ